MNDDTTKTPSSGTPTFQNVNSPGVSAPTAPMEPTTPTTPLVTPEVPVEDSPLTQEPPLGSVGETSTGPGTEPGVGDPVLPEEPAVPETTTGPSETAVGGVGSKPNF